MGKIENDWIEIWEAAASSRTWIMKTASARFPYFLKLNNALNSEKSPQIWAYFLQDLDVLEFA